MGDMILIPLIQTSFMQSESGLLNGATVVGVWLTDHMHAPVKMEGVNLESIVSTDMFIGSYILFQCT